MSDTGPATRYPIGLDIADEHLRERVSARLATWQGLRLAEDVEEAAVIIADVPDAEEAGALCVAARGTSFHFPSSPLELALSAAHLLAAGCRIASPQAENAGSGPGGGGPRGRGGVRLSAREHEVLELLVDGASNKTIARNLAISVHTAKFHVTAVLTKLDARNRSDAVAIALREGHVRL